MADMTMRERMLALVRGEPVDRVPFVQYDHLAAPNEEIWSTIGRQEMGVLRWTTPFRRDHANCTRTVTPIVRDGLRGEHTVIETPAGIMQSQRFFEPAYNTAWTAEHFVKTPPDYDVLTAWLDDEVIVADVEPLACARRELGEDGLPLVRVERTAFQQLWIQWVSLDDLVCHMMDEPERVATCIAALQRRQRDVFGVIADLDVDFVDIPDNITAPVIGERWFRQYCLPDYNDLASLVDVPVYVHMDGDLAPLYEAIGESKISGIDSLSPPPDNDTSPGAALAMWPHMRVAINFPASVHLASPEQVYAVTMDLLEQAGDSGRFQIQISENVPQSHWRQSFPQIVRAIHDFHD
ncbi:MAG TPA: hypothetical protein QF604_06785 [Candidatus Latescibacteria bacterium]|jgi:hypothetical protein|nr:uroporphyrinogen decarboxylase family protein [Candidatus Latescibacterota bacterium]HJN27605.1 hypothetical protein [Candidatus Latescibacterota bacterium]